MPAVAGPDFICIGMQKAGTDWLYDQLQFHPDLWMPPMKEIRYLDRDITTAGRAGKILEHWRNDSERHRKRQSKRRASDDRDLAFLEQVVSYRGDPMDLERYASLFRYKGPLKSGDVTPGYSGLREEVIARVAQRFPDVRVVFLLRDPVARSWSQISMAHRNDRFDISLLDDLQAFREFLKTSDNLERVGYPTRIAGRWKRNAPAEMFRYFFFDDLVADAAGVRREILTWIGIDPDKSSGELAAGHNKKSAAQKLELTPEIRGVLIDHFREELLACAEMFSGHARTWVTNYGL